ncbi:MAG: TerB family tellurite resistance protein [Pseudomonadota bacterium]
MFDRIIALLEEDDRSGETAYDTIDIASAVAALYFHMIAADGIVTTAEIDRFRTMLREQFDLDDEALDQVVTRGAQEDRSSPGIFSFTAILNREMDADARAGILERLAELANADGEVDPLEADMLAHVSKLLRLDA